jgi:2-dehydropantoate 2-reductase
VKIGVVGCGAVGSYYGAKLCRDGHETHFLLRSDYEQVKRRGIAVRSSEGDFNVRPRAARAPGDIGTCDLVLVAIKSIANTELAQLIPPLVGETTAVLSLQNGLGNEEIIASIVGADRVLGGLCFVCLNRVEPGVIHHIAHARITLGEFQRWPEPRTHDIASAIRHAGVPCKVAADLVRARWEKLVWNIPFNGLGVASRAGYDAVLTGRARQAAQGKCLTTNELLGDPLWHELVRELMQEVIHAANALGLGISPELVDRMIHLTRSMGAYKPSTVLDFEAGRAIELDSIFLEPLRRAQAAGVSLPRLSALCQILSSFGSGSFLEPARPSTG